ncbi:type III-B CRISPR module RAMP protein Cmr4 [Hydrogenobaculum acidophilum]
MYEKSAILTFYAESPIHMGTGQSISYVDLPIQRERHTSFLILWSSGIKGVLRDLAKRLWNNKNLVEAIFGPENEGSNFAGCISITDAKILLYPVRSVRGIFAWITCPFVLKRLKEDLTAAGVKLEGFSFNGVLDEGISDDCILVSNDSNLIVEDSNLIVEEKTVALEEFVFKADMKNTNILTKIANCLKLLIPSNDLTKNLDRRIAIVSDNVFADLVNYAVEIRTRIRINHETGTVDGTALFTEEFIPSESIFYSLMFIRDSFQKNNSLNADYVNQELSNLFKQSSLLQLGGNETLGKGLVRAKFFKRYKSRFLQSDNEQKSQ